MRVIVATTRSEIRIALDKAHVPAVVVRSADELERECGRVGMALLDLRDDLCAEPLATIQRILQNHPFLKLGVIAPPTTTDPGFYFTLGQVGVWRVVSATAVKTEAWWQELYAHGVTHDVIERFERVVRPYLQSHPHPLQTLFLPHFHKASVKQLAQAMPIHRSLSVEAKRRMIWSVCLRSGLMPPEQILSGLRLMFIRFMLEDKAWTTARLAQYLDFGSERAMWRSVKRRSGLSPKALRAMSLSALFASVQQGFTPPQ